MFEQTFKTYNTLQFKSTVKIHFFLVIIFIHKLKLKKLLHYYIDTRINFTQFEK